MSQLDTTHTWKDEKYRLNLSEADLTPLPDHPAGLIELTDADLGVTGSATKLFVGNLPFNTTDADLET